MYLACYPPLSHTGPTCRPGTSSGADRPEPRPHRRYSGRTDPGHWCWSSGTGTSSWINTRGKTRLMVLGITKKNVILWLHALTYKWCKDKVIHDVKTVTVATQIINHWASFVHVVLICTTNDSFQQSSLSQNRQGEFYRPPTNCMFLTKAWHT